MAPQRRIDVVLDSVKRLLRIGATANLLNLLQKQHPADLAQVFGSLLDTERQAVFSILVERSAPPGHGDRQRNGSRRGRQAADRPIRRRNCEVIAGNSIRRCGGVDRLPAGRAVVGSPGVDAAARVGPGRKPARIRRADRGPHHEPAGLRAQRGPDGRRGDHGAAKLARRRNGVLPLRRRCAAPPRWRDVAAAPVAGVARDAAEAHHDAGGHERPRRHRPGRSGAAGRLV